MNLHRCLLLGLGLILASPSVLAQFPQPQPTFIIVRPPGLSFSYSRVTSKSAFALTYNPPMAYPTISYPTPFGPYVPYPPVIPLSPYYPYAPISPYVVATGFTQIVVSQPPTIIPPSALAPLDPLPIDPVFALPARPGEAAGNEHVAMAEAAKPRREGEGFRPQEAEKKEPPAPPPPPPPVKIRPPWVAKLEPRQESTRQIELGKEAFAQQQYGRAAERFQQAVDLDPTSAMARFLLGQAHLALGNYRRAYDALQSGLRMQPDWSRHVFRSLDLYGDNVVDLAEHIRILEDLLALTPNDPELLFLAGYQLWFDGRREEAQPLLERAAPHLPDPTMIQQFLRGLPASDVF